MVGTGVTGAAVVGAAVVGGGVPGASVTTGTSVATGASVTIGAGVVGVAGSSLAPVAEPTAAKAKNPATTPPVTFTHRGFATTQLRARLKRPDSSCIAAFLVDPDLGPTIERRPEPMMVTQVVASMST
jgi:hypothetical protein